jgi:photosystem II stability/assembly factor-like uncharacterized protein
LTQRFIPSRRQFALGAAGLAASSTLLPGALLAQDTPGWRKLPTEPYRGKQDDIAFASPDTGWYGNGAGKLYRTLDGGESWQIVRDQPGTFIRALGFIDAETGFIGNVGTDYYPGVTDAHPLYRTRDGGATWEAVTAPGIERMKGVCGIDILPVRRVYQGELRTTHIVHAAGRVGGNAMVLASRDGGDSWALTDLSAQIGMILDIKFLDERRGFIAAATSADIQQAEATILATEDGGGTWTSVYRSGRAMENIWKMAWPSATTGYATVQSYDSAIARRVVLKTIDGGRNWQELPLAEGADIRELGVGFVDEQRGWVGCTASGYETRDGGASWQPAPMGRAVNKIRVVRGASTTRIFAIGVDIHCLDIG